MSPRAYRERSSGPRAAARGGRIPALLLVTTALGAASLAHGALAQGARGNSQALEEVAAVAARQTSTVDKAALGQGAGGYGFAHNSVQPRLIGFQANDRF